MDGVNVTWQFDNLCRWARAVLSAQLVEAGHAVCELGCGAGDMFAQWDARGVTRLVAVDATADTLTAARAAAGGRTFTAEFVQGDPLDAAVVAQLGAAPAFDAVAALDPASPVSLDCCAFASDSAVGAYLAAVAGVLRPGGYFFGLCGDSAALWAAAQRRRGGSATAEGQLYTLVFGDAGAYAHTGSRVTLRIKAGGGVIGEESAREGFLVHFPTLIEHAHTHGLRFIGATNLVEFFAQNRRQYDEELTTFKVLDRGRLRPEHAALAALHAVFVLRRPPDAPG